MNVNIKEVERYLGYRGMPVTDDRMRKNIEECILEMESRVTPREVHKVFDINRSDDKGKDGKAVQCCEFAGIEVAGGNLVRNLKGCSEIVLMAVTIGPEPDRLVRRAELRDMLKAYIFQAVGAAMVESWCDDVNGIIREEAEKRGLFTRPRFSPGYGDFPLTVQRDFERVLDMPKTIGVSLSDSLLMTPTKSITAVIGLSKYKTDCHMSGCEECNMWETCEFSRK